MTNSLSKNPLISGVYVAVFTFPDTEGIPDKFGTSRRNYVVLSSISFLVEYGFVVLQHLTSSVYLNMWSSHMMSVV